VPALGQSVGSASQSDNLRSGITKACFYEPALNRTYAEMAAHHKTAIVPARPYRARDKAKVEVAVLATRFIIAQLRNRQFFSLSALNAAIAELVTQINNRVSRHLGASRRALFEDLERSALKPLPVDPYVFAEWKECRVGLDYHVEIEKHYYWVPHQLLRCTNCHHNEGW
jgi:transposase